jgi:RNA polymerase sigma factor (sigma-70 family)
MRDEDREIYSRHAGELTRFATAVVGPNDAQDVVSIAVVSAFTSKSWPTVENHRAYLYRSVLNASHSFKRSDARRRAREQSTAPTTDVTVQPEFQPEVFAAVEDLSPRQRAVVFLTYWEDCTTAETADRLGISQGSVKRHLERARNNLRRTLNV